MTTAAPERPQVPEQQIPEEATRLELYRTMVLIRTFEEAILREYHADKAPGFDIGKGEIPGEMHLAAGQEPVAAGVCAHLTSEDAVTATHRPHHFAVAHGVDLKRMTAEIFGRRPVWAEGEGGTCTSSTPARTSPAPGSSQRATRPLWGRPSPSATTQPTASPSR